MAGRIRKIFVGVIALLMSAALCACGGGNAKKENSEKSQSNATSGGSIVVGIMQDLDSLDPHSMAYAGTREVLFNVFEGLVKTDSTGDLKPAVASEYSVSDDATVYSFKLREGIKFHDGSYVTVEDIKYSVERYADIQKESSAFSILKEVKIVDDSTIEVVLTEGNTEFLAQLTCAIMPQANDENLNKVPVGTGPFKYSSYIAGQKFVVERFEDYWGDKAYLEGVTFKIVSDSDVALMELQAGTLDIYQYLTTDQAVTLSSGFDIYEGSVNYVQALFLNNDFEPFTNLKVRQAMCYGIDKEEITNFLFDGKSHIIGTNMIPALKKYYNEQTESIYTYDTDTAIKLLKEAGYQSGFELKITVPDNYAPHAGAAEIIVEQLKKIGITATIELVDFSTWYDKVYINRNYEATVVAVDGTLAPGSYFEKNVSSSSVNFTNYNNAEFDRLYKEAILEIDDEKKVELYKELQMVMTKDAASVYIEDPANLVAVNSKLGGYIFYPVAAQDLSVVYYK